MARANVYLPDDLYDEAKQAGLNISQITQEALRDRLKGSATDRWLDSLRVTGTGPRADVAGALAETRRGMSGELDG